MNNSLVVVLLLLAIVALFVLRIVVRVRAVRKMRSKPRPDHLKPVVPIIFAVLVIVVFGLGVARAPAAALPQVLLLGAGTLIAAMAAMFFTNRDLRQRAGDSWDTRRLTVDGAVALVLYLVMFAGLIFARTPLNGGVGYSWASPIASILLLLIGSGVAALWRRRHPTDSTASPAPTGPTQANRSASAAGAPDTSRWGGR